MITLIWLILAYLIGSISFAILLSKLLHIDDPRSYGSKNPGATNVLRSGKKSIALLTLLGDGLKGFIPVFLAQQYTDFSATSLTAIALAAFIGHLYPVFFQFKGGKGVATFLGAVLALSAIVGVFILLIWLVIAIGTRYSSLSSLLSSISTPFLFIFHQEWHLGVWAIWLSTMIILLFIKHKDNIRKLLNHTESKIFSKTHSMK